MFQQDADKDQMLEDMVTRVQQELTQVKLKSDEKDL